MVIAFFIILILFCSFFFIFFLLIWVPFIIFRRISTLVFVYAFVEQSEKFCVQSAFFNFFRIFFFFCHSTSVIADSGIHRFSISVCNLFEKKKNSFRFDTPYARSYPVSRSCFKVFCLSGRRGIVFEYTIARLLLDKRINFFTLRQPRLPPLRRKKKKKKREFFSSL